MLNFTTPNMAHTECANCNWNTPCYDDGEAYICIDRDMCAQNRRINDLTWERNEAIARRDALLEACKAFTDDLPDSTIEFYGWFAERTDRIWLHRL